MSAKGHVQSVWTTSVDTIEGYRDFRRYSLQPVWSQSLERLRSMT